MFRDKRVRNGVLVAPIFMIAIFTLAIGAISEKLSKDPDIKIAVIKDEGNPLVDALKAQGGNKIKIVPTLNEGLTELKAGDIHLIMEYPHDLGEAVTTGQSTIIAHYTKESPLSLLALRALGSQVEKANKTRVEAILEAKGGSKLDATPLLLKEVDHTKKEGLGGSELLTLIPYLIVVWALYGGMGIVSDLVAGEKERGTMETLVISPARRSQIAWGKLLALASICLMSSMTTVVGIIILGLSGLPATKAMFPNGFTFQPINLLMIVVIVAPLAAFFAGAMVTVSAFAKNIRESQTYLTSMSFIVLLPAIMSQFIGLAGMEKAAWVSWTPILNTSVALKGVLAANPNYPLMGVSILTNASLAILMGFLAISAFNREEIVNRS